MEFPIVKIFVLHNFIRFVISENYLSNLSIIIENLIVQLNSFLERLLLIKKMP